MKKTIGILLALILALTMLPSAAFAEGEITDFAGLKAAAGTAGEYTLGADIAVSETLEISADVTINGGGKTLTYGEGFTGSVFKVNNGGKLTLKNVVIDGGNAWEWRLDDNISSEENNATRYDDSISRPEAGKILAVPTFNISSGTLSLENSTIRNAVYNVESASYNNDCGIIYAEGGKITLSGVNISKIAGTIVKSSGTAVELKGSSTISDCYGCGNKGGLFIISGGTIDMENTSIKNNKTWVRSGEVFGIVNNAVFTMNSGEIDSNVCRHGGSNTSGSMICVESGGKFIMNGGSITNNVGFRAGAISSRWTVGNHGVDNGIHLNGGIISGNTTKLSDWKEASVFVRGTLNINSNMTVSGIVVSDSDSKLNNLGTIIGDLIINNASAAATSSGNVKGHITVTNGTLTITGGYYGDSIEAITPYLADGLRAVPSDDPEYTCMVVPAGAVRVSFDVNGGDALVPSFTYTDGQGVLSQLPAATRANYRFNGWYTAPMGGTRIIEGSIFTADTTVFAQWTYIESGSSGDDYPIFTTPAPAPAPVGLPTTGDMTIFEMILSWLGLL